MLTTYHIAAILSKPVCPERAAKKLPSALALGIDFDIFKCACVGLIMAAILTAHAHACWQATKMNLDSS